MDGDATQRRRENRFRSHQSFIVKVAMMVVAVMIAAILTMTSVGHAATTISKPSEVGDFSIVADTGIAIPLTRLQSDIFELGGGQMIKGFFVINDYFDIGPSAAYLALPAKESRDPFGTALTLGGSARIKRPFNAPRTDDYYDLSPWADADLLYVRTGNLNRPGFAVGAGLSIPIGESRSFRVGPFVRYLQILQSRTDMKNADAKILSVGISIEVGATTTNHAGNDK